MLKSFVAIAGCTCLNAAAFGQLYTPTYSAPDLDRWMYPFNSTPGAELRAPTFAALEVAGFDDRDSQMLVRFDTGTQVPAGRPASDYKIVSGSVRLTVATSTAGVIYDPTADSVASSYQMGNQAYVPDNDAGKPVELFGVGFRGGFSVSTFNENSPFGCMGFPVEGCRNAFAVDFVGGGAAADISRQVRQRIETAPWAVGVARTIDAGAVLTPGTQLFFDFDVSRPGVRDYIKQALADGRLMLAATSLHPASGGPGGGTSTDYPSFVTKEANPAESAKLFLRVRVYTGADFNADGVVDFFDYLDFVNEFSEGSFDSDFNEDGVIDFFDYLDFVDAFSR